jgi:hypothetical protein
MFVERAGLEDPFQSEIPGIGRANLRERAMTLTVEIARIGQPVLRLLIRAKDPLERDGCHGRFAVLGAAASPLSPEWRGDGNEQEQTGGHG